MNTKVLILIVVGVLILVNVISSRWFYRIDLTKNGQYSISESTHTVLSNVSDLITVKAYFTSDLPPQFLPLKQYVRDILSEYRAYGEGNFEYEFVDPAKNAQAVQEAARIGIQKVRMNVRGDNSFQVKDGYLGIGIFFEGETESIPFVNQESIGTLEYDLTSLIVKMTQPRDYVVAFLSGHGEHKISQAIQLSSATADEDYTAFEELLRASYDVKTIDFADQDTLDDVDVLIVAGAKRDLTDRDLFEIDQYLLAGGRALFLIDGIEQIGAGLNLQVLDTNLKTFLSPVGVSVESNVVLDKVSELANFSEGAGRFFFLQYPPFIRLVEQNFTQHPIIANVPGFVVRFASSLSVQETEGLVYDRFINTSPASWIQEYPFQLSPQNIEPDSDTGGSKVIAVAVSGMFPRLSDFDNVPVLEQWVENEDSGEFELVKVSEDTHRDNRTILTEAESDALVVVFSDSDFASDGSVKNDQTPLVVLLNTVDFMALGDQLISIRSKSLSGASILPFESLEMSIMKFLGILLIPILVVIYGVFRLWLRRKEEKLLKL